MRHDVEPAARVGRCWDAHSRKGIASWSAGTAVRSPSPLELDDFEQELVDQYALAAAASGTTDNHIAHERSVLFAFIRHIGRHVVIDSCVDCLCWGITRTNKWLCEGCRGLRRRFPAPGTCLSCHRTITVNADGFCRLCWRQSVGERPHGTGLSILEANRHGQQLYFADLFRQRRSIPAPPATPRRRHREYPVLHRQLSLVDLTRDIARGQRRGFQDPPDPEFARLLDLAAHEHAAAHGWSKTRLNDARKGIRILLSIQDTAGSVIRTTEVSQLEQISLAVQPVLDVLESAGLLDSDRKPALLAWFDRQTASLPDLMRDEVRVWFDVLRLGSTTPPRCRPRAEPTIRLRIRYALPALQAWAADGHTALREITRDQVKTALPDQGSDRSLVGQALRSLFRLLKARRMIFTNPTRSLSLSQTSDAVCHLPRSVDHRVASDGTILSLGGLV